jgi:hypothetical protein
VIIPKYAKIIKIFLCTILKPYKKRKNTFQHFPFFHNYNKYLLYTTVSLAASGGISHFASLYADYLLQTTKASYGRTTSPVSLSA